MIANEDSHLAIQFRVKIRRLEKADLPKLEWQGQFLHYRRLFSRSYQSQLEGNRYLLVADVKNHPIGRLFIQYGKQKSILSDGQSRAYLYSFYVHDLFQGQGIGTKMMDSAETLLRERHFKMVTISVAKTNLGALRLYQGRNYRIFAETEGNWSYTDHRGILQKVHEPSWLLEKPLSYS